MKRTEPQSIGDVCRLVLEESDMITHLLERRACDYWKLLVGRPVASQATPPKVERGIMKIGIADAPLRHELTMNRSRMVRLINERFGQIVITDIRFTSI